jgi:hypothetical protein
VLEKCDLASRQEETQRTVVGSYCQASVTFRVGGRLRVFEKRVLRRISVDKGGGGNREVEKTT